jgi:hypothetical protein
LFPEHDGTYTISNNSAIGGNEIFTKK